jgi:hypothetical protein
VWIYTQSNITSIIFTWVHYTNKEKVILDVYQSRDRSFIKRIVPVNRVSPLHMNSPIYSRVSLVKVGKAENILFLNILLEIRQTAWEAKYVSIKLSGNIFIPQQCSRVCSWWTVVFLLCMVCPKLKSEPITNTQGLCLLLLLHMKAWCSVSRAIKDAFHWMARPLTTEFLSLY